jgi:hypothetical protein
MIVVEAVAPVFAPDVSDLVVPLHAIFAVTAVFTVTAITIFSQLANILFNQYTSKPEY